MDTTTTFKFETMPFHHVMMKDRNFMVGTKKIETQLNQIKKLLSKKIIARKMGVIV